MKVSVILVSYNTIELTRRALDYLLGSLIDFGMEVIIVDNDSRDNSAEIIKREYPNVKLIENKKNVGFGRANNQALPYISGRYVLLLNTDAFVESDTVQKTVQYMEENSKCGILGVKFLTEEGKLQPSCRYFPTPLNIFINRIGMSRYIKGVKMVDDMSWDHSTVRECDWVPGCYFLIRKDVIDQIGFFDPRYFLYYEEIDFCFAAKKAGWNVTFFPYSSVIHLGGESAKSDSKITSSGRQIEALQMESELIYFRKNEGLSSAVANSVLLSISDCILVIKDTLKFRIHRKLMIHLIHLYVIWKLFFKTRIGRQSTR